MRRREILALFDKHQRIEIEHPDMDKEVLHNVVRFVRPAPGYGQITYNRLDEDNADAEIREQIAYYSQRGLSFTWRVYDYDTPLDLHARLLAMGFEDDDPAALMVLDLAALRAAPTTLLGPVEADVRRITARDQIADVIRVEEQVWGGDFGWMVNRLGLHLEIPGYLSLYVAYVDDQPACAGWTYFHPSSPFAGLWGGSTVPAYRSRGLYTAVLATRVQEAIERGYGFLYVEATDMSRPIVARHGFDQLATVYGVDWLSEPSAT
jgi:hypothetical protein